MKRAGILGLVAVFTVGLVAAPADAKPQKVKVETDVVIDDFDVGDDDVTFFGHITCEKRKCLKRRTIHLEQTDFDIDAGSAKTDANGAWEITFDQDVAGPGNYQATADKKKIKKRRNGEVKKVIVCKPGVSETFVATPS